MLQDQEKYDELKIPKRFLLIAYTNRVGKLLWALHDYFQEFKFVNQQIFTQKQLTKKSEA